MKQKKIKTQYYKKRQKTLKNKSISNQQKIYFKNNLFITYSCKRIKSLETPENKTEQALDQGGTEKNAEHAVCTPSTGHWDYPKQALREERDMSEHPGTVN